MSSGKAVASEFGYDAFISYSRKDAAFARRLEKTLRAYRPPRELAVPQRALRIFRDDDDFLGPEYHQSLDRNLRTASKLIVVCSPHAAASEYVADEIRRFAAVRGKEHIISLLIDGIPNNEATERDADRKAFPEALVELLPIPLAADYRGLDPKRGNIKAGRFASAWFKTLGDLYADFGVDRAQVERRERNRRVRQRRNLALAGTALVVVVAGLSVLARQQRNLAVARGLAEEAGRAYASGNADSLVHATLLAVASLRTAPTVVGQATLTQLLGILPRPPAWRRDQRRLANTGVTGGRRGAVAFSPDGARLATIRADHQVELLDAQTGSPIRPVSGMSNSDRIAGRTVVAFSRDGAYLVAGCEGRACVFDTASGRLLARLPGDGRPQGEMVWSASFSPDNRALAVASYGDPSIHVYDVPSWRIASQIDPGAGVFTVAFSPDSAWLVVGTSGEIQLWRAGQYAAPIARVPTRGGIAWSIAFLERTRIVTAANEIKSWAITDDGAVRLQEESTRPIQAHTLIPVQWQGQSCLVAAGYSGVHLLCGRDLEEVLRVPTPSVAAAVSPDGEWLASQDDKQVLASWRLGGGMDAHRVAVGAPIRSLATDGRGWVAAGTDSGTIVVVGATDWKERARARVPERVAGLSTSAGGRWLVATTGSSVHVLDASTWREVTKATYETPVAWAAYDAAGRSLLVATDTALVLLNPADWTERVRITLESSLQDVSVSPDGGRVATVTHQVAGHDEGVLLTRVFDAATGRELGGEYTSGRGNISVRRMEDEMKRTGRGRIWGDTALVRQSTSWSPLPAGEPEGSSDSVWVVRVRGSTIELTNAEEQRRIGTLTHGSKIRGVRFIPASESKWLVSAGEDGTLRIWPLTAQDLVTEACARLRGSLTAEALTRYVEKVGRPSCAVQ